MATSVVAGVNLVTVTVDKPADRPDLKGIYVWRSTSNGFTPSGTAAGVGNCVYAGPDLQVVFNGLPAGTVQYFKMAYISAIDETDYIVSAQYSATPLVPVVDASAITGQLTAAQIASLAASQITGQLTDAQLAAISAAKVTGTLTASQLSLNIGGGNLLTNSSFEADANGDGIPDGWTDTSIGTGITVTRSLVATPLVAHGTKSLQLQVTSVTAPTTNNHQVAQDVADCPVVRPGQKYVFSVYAQTSTLAYSLLGQVHFLNAANDIISNHTLSGTFDAVNTPQRFVLNPLTAPAGAVKARGWLGLTRPSTGDTTLGSVLFDGVQLEEADIVTAYAPRPLEILPGTVGTTQIADDAITSDKVIAGAIVAGKIAAGAVSATELSAGAVTTAKLAAGAVTAATIAANTITAEQIAASAVTATELAAGAVTTAKLVAGAVTANELASNSVTAAKIAALSVSADKIAANTITAGQIAANTITAGQIAGGTITAAELSAGAITASKLLISDFSNVYPDFDMEDPDFYASGTGAVYGFTATTAVGLGRRFLSFSANAAQHSVASGWLPIDPSAEYRISGAAWSNNADSTSVLQFQVGTLNADGSVAVSRTIEIGRKTTSYGFPGSHMATDLSTTSSEKRIRFLFYRLAGGTGSTQVGALRIQRRMTGELVVDGAITADKLSATALDAKHIRGTNVFSGVFGSKGSVLAAAAAVDATSLTLQNAADFPSSGSGWIYDWSVPALSRVDNFSWTGKSGNTLTGVSGVSVAHGSGQLVIPALPTIIVSHEGNEVMGFGDRGDGVTEPVFRLGVGTDDATILDLGVQNSTLRALNATRYGDDEVASFSRTATDPNSATSAVRVSTAGGPGLEITGISGQGAAITTRPAAGYGALFKLNAGSEPRYPHIRMEPSSTSPAAAGSVDGALYMAPAGLLKGYDGSSWRQFLRESDTIKAAAGSETAPGLTFGVDVNTGIYRPAANQIGFTTNGTLAGTVNGSGDWNFTRFIAVGDASPSSAVNINSLWTGGGNATVMGLQTYRIVDSTDTLTAARSWYGGYTEARSIMSSTAANGYLPVLFGSYSVARRGTSAGGVDGGVGNVLYGAVGMALNYSSSADAPADMMGGYFRAHNHGSVAASTIRGVAAQAWIESGSNTATSLIGVDSTVSMTSGAATNGYLFKGLYSGPGLAGIGTKWGIHVTGCTDNLIGGVVQTAGIKFAASQVNSSDPNTLDDYEEGTFTPVVRGTTTAGTATYTTQGGRYTKIGNRVMGELAITWTALNGAGNLEIAGLPFVHASGHHTPVTLFLQNVSITAGSSANAWVNSGASTISLYQLTADGVSSGIPLDTTGTIRVGFQYETA